MNAHRTWLLLLVALVFLATPYRASAQDIAPLPDGVRAVWDLDKASREKTDTREQVCLNGLWQWQPGTDAAAGVPAGNWGWFKVPGCWPGITDYMQKDCQTVYFNPAWKDVGLGDLTSAWYQREFTVPSDWTGRHITVSTEYLNSFATVYIDGQKAGAMQFPAGEVDLTSLCKPGSKHVLSMLVVALPLKEVVFSHNDTSRLKEEKGSVARRGLCGDVWLTATPAASRIDDVKVATSVRKGEITFDVNLTQLAPDGKYNLRAGISFNGAQHDSEDQMFTSSPFTAADVKDGHFIFTEKWKAQKIWDTKSPQNTYTLSLSLLGADGKTLDTALPVRFGYREFWIDGRDFYLNGTRIHLSCLPIDNTGVSAGLSTYDAVKETFLRMKSFGINFVYTHNYDCEPGAHLSFEELLRAADDTGMLVSFSQPHFSDYEWKAPDADANNGYARHAAYYVHIAGSHPSVIFYSMSHNATGYDEDMNPDLIDGINAPRNQWSSENVQNALRAEAIVEKLDPARIVYHHSSGNLGSMHDSNFYPNMVPSQELDDWLEHWATKGVKPFFTCEYAAPGAWDWTMYRGWYKGKREFGSAQLQWEFCYAEWAAQFLGDRAFNIQDEEKTNLRWEAKKFHEGAEWFRWDYPYEVGSNKFNDREEVTGQYTADNWRAFRTWGLSGNSPWEHAIFWRLRDGVDKKRIDYKTDWDNLQRPGYSPDYIDERYEAFDTAFERSDWIPLPPALALMRNNMPLLAYIGGKADAFTSKDHNFTPGEKVEKQLIIINDSRDPVEAEYSWTLGMANATADPAVVRKKISVPPGDQVRVPITFVLPDNLRPGDLYPYPIAATVKFSTGETQTDGFSLNILAPPPSAKTTEKIALYDPPGQTAELLDRLGVAYRKVEAQDKLDGYDLLVIGKGALTLAGPGPDLTRVRDGLKVVMFEQTTDVLQQRLGFRVNEYGLRQVFPRLAGHPVLSGLSVDNLRDWRGSSTILPPQLKYVLSDAFDGAPTVQWNGITVTRLWRCGNRGDVASVLIEKPARGDFLPILDGGFSLQYSPLMEYREGKGMVIFCQVDVTGRTETDPAADLLTHNLIAYALGWSPGPARQVLYAGDPAGKSFLEKAGLTISDYKGQLTDNQVLIVTPGAGKVLDASSPLLADALKAGGRILAIGLGQDEANAFLPFKVSMNTAEHIATNFPPFAPDSPFAGIGPADVYNRDPHDFQLVTKGGYISDEHIVGDGVLAETQDDHAIFCQLVPWSYDYAKQYDLKRTFRRSAFLVDRLLANMGVVEPTALLGRFSTPVDPAKNETRWLDGLYAETPEEMDDPYRFFRW